jgi:opacity protein-like surface antigen
MILKFAFLFVVAMAVSASAPAQDASAAKPAAPPTAHKEADAERAYSGMYTFLKEGEFVQLTVEDDKRVTGFISRYGESESDKGAFLDQFFKSAKLEGNKLNFTTDIVHGVSYDFHGTVERGEGKNPGDEAYFVLKGWLTENSSDVNKKVTSQSQEVAFKMFPQDAAK